MDIDRMHELLNTLDRQVIRSYLHMRNTNIGSENMTQMLPLEIIDYITDQLYPGRTRQY